MTSDGTIETLENEAANQKVQTSSFDVDIHSAVRAQVQNIIRTELEAQDGGIFKQLKALE